MRSGISSLKSNTERNSASGALAVRKHADILDLGNGYQRKFYLFYFLFLGPRVWHMEVSRLVVEPELQLPAYTTAIAMLHPNHVCDLHCSLQQCQILNPLNGTRDRTCILMDTNQVHSHWATIGTPSLRKFYSIGRIGRFSLSYDTWPLTHWTLWTWALPCSNTSKNGECDDTCHWLGFRQEVKNLPLATDIFIGNICWPREGDS